MDQIFSVSRMLLGQNAWNTLKHGHGKEKPACQFPETVQTRVAEAALPDYLPDLVRLEWAYYQAGRDRTEIPQASDEILINPALHVFHHSWILSPLFKKDSSCKPVPVPKEEYVLIWRHPDTGQVRLAAADAEDLLALKIAVDEQTLADVADQGNLTTGQLEDLMLKEIHYGLLIGPRSKIRRDPVFFPKKASIDRNVTEVGIFTLQWHITHACDMACKHCYDRSKRKAVTLNQGRDVMADFYRFCREHNIRGHVCFSGGNPFLHPDFESLYRTAVSSGFTCSILANPVSRSRVEKLIHIRHPTYYQVSLEGLPDHNDEIRGSGSYARVIDFLGILRDLKVTSAVMLTLTRENMDQVLPLAERLRGHADHFTFNRLSLTGEGAGLALPDPEAYVRFLHQYNDACGNNPILGMKDNLINIIRHREKQPLFGGCTAFGCGAAFSFLALLPDGEVHACRKFPSLLGNAYTESISGIYHSEPAVKYRQGSASCTECGLKTVCGGCMAVTSSMGLDMTSDRDPFCFID